MNNIAKLTFGFFLGMCVTAVGMEKMGAEHQAQNDSQVLQAMMDQQAEVLPPPVL